MFFDFYQREYLYSQYKDGLKILMKGDHNEAERLFELILTHSYLESVSFFSDRPIYFFN